MEVSADGQGPVGHYGVLGTFGLWGVTHCHEERRLQKDFWFQQGGNQRHTLHISCILIKPWSTSMKFGIQVPLEISLILKKFEKNFYWLKQVLKIYQKF